VLPEAPRSKAPAAAAVEAPATPKRKLAAGNVAVLVGLLLLLVAAGTFVYVKFFLGRGPGAPPPPPRAAKTPRVEPSKPPAPVPAIGTTLAAASDEPTVVVAPQAGAIVSIAAQDAEVVAGDVVARLAGFDRIEKELARSRERLKVYQDVFDQAAARNDKAAMRAAEQNIKRKQADLERGAEKLARFVVTSPVAGKVEPAVAARARVAAGAELATIVSSGAPIGTFAGAPSRTVGSTVEVRAASDATRSAMCVVTASDAAGLAVACPAKGPLAVGDKVVLAPEAGGDVAPIPGAGTAPDKGSAEGSTKPEATKPAATKPAATKPAATKPAATKPEASTPPPPPPAGIAVGEPNPSTPPKPAPRPRKPKKPAAPPPAAEDTPAEAKPAEAKPAEPPPAPAPAPAEPPPPATP
jgi:hypothetical protein